MPKAEEAANCLRDFLIDRNMVPVLVFTLSVDAAADEAGMDLIKAPYLNENRSGRRMLLLHAIHQLASVLEFEAADDLEADLKVDEALKTWPQ